MQLLCFFRDVEVSAVLRKYGYLRVYVEKHTQKVSFMLDPQSARLSRKLKKQIKVHDPAGNNIFSMKGGNDGN
jgi:hypothetical protein